MELAISASVDESVPSGVVSDAAATPPNAQRFVTFYLGETLFAVAASAVSEVGSKLSPVPLPDSPRSLAGIAPLRGDIVSVVDLKAIEGELSQNPSPKPKSLVMKLGDSINDMAIAFNVDKIGELVAIPFDKVVPLKGSNDKVAQFHASLDGRTIRIIDPAQLGLLLAFR